jgi:hypothetical protein
VKRGRRNSRNPACPAPSPHPNHFSSYLRGRRRPDSDRRLDVVKRPSRKVTMVVPSPPLHLRVRVRSHTRNPPHPRVSGTITDPGPVSEAVSRPNCPCAFAPAESSPVRVCSVASELQTADGVHVIGDAKTPQLALRVGACRSMC